MKTLENDIQGKRKKGRKERKYKKIILKLIKQREK